MKECCGTCKYLGSEYDTVCTNCDPYSGKSGYEPSEEFIEMERLAEIGKATKKAFEDGVFLTYALFSYEGEILEYEIQEDVEDLLEWYRGRQTND